MALSTASFAQQNVKTNGTHYSLLIEGTGAWCQHCSDGAAYVEDVLSKTPNCIAVSEHNSDGMSFPDGNTLDAALNDGWPWGSVDMHYFNGGKIAQNRSYWQSDVNSQLALPAKYDLTMTHSYDQSTRTLTVTLTGKALTALTGKYNFNVYLDEDSVVGPNSNQYNQHNDSTRYNEKVGHRYYHANNDPTKWYIIGFKHMQVLRAMLGGVWGVEAANNPAVNSTATKTFTYVIPAKYDVLDVKLNKLKIVGIVQKAVTGSPSSTNAPEILNSVQAKVLPWNPANVSTLSNFEEVELFPNPANDFIAIRALLNEPSETKVVITNSVGQVVFNQIYPIGGSLFAQSINISNFNNGLYFATISSNGSSNTQKFIVAK